jgi:hypothetical protein
MIVTRKITLAFLGVFIIGALTGVVLTMTFGSVKFTHFLDYTNDPQSMAKRINHKYISEYQLSAEEQEKIAPLVSEMTAQLYAERNQFAVSVLNTLDDYHNKISTLMTDEHSKAYQKDNIQRKEHISQMLMLKQNPDAQGAK